jgi:UDP-glucose 4-epimerase
MNKLKIGILGAKGFVGKALVDQFLLEKNFLELHLYARNKETNTNFKNVFYHQFNLNSESLSYPPSLLEIDVLYYLISESIPASSWDFPSNEIQNNLIPFTKLIEQLKKGNLKKIIFTSSAGTIYGPSTEKIKEDGLKNPFSPHGITKLTTEYFLEYFKTKYGIQYDIFRISNIYGPGQNTSKGLGLINTLLEKMIRKEEILIYGDGSNTRNYIYIDDVANILNQAINNDLNISNTLNLASSYHYTINEIISKIEVVSNIKLSFTKSPPRNSDNTIIMIDNTKLKVLFPQFKDTNIELGIKESLNYLTKLQ